MCDAQSSATRRPAPRLPRADRLGDVTWHRDGHNPRRRKLLAAALGIAAARNAIASEAREATGWVLPRLAALPIELTNTDGRSQTLSKALAGRVTAVQLMFTGCSSTCPIQGALFAELARQLRTTDVQLLSISIDALGDSLPALASWQARFGAHRAWAAALPKIADVDSLARFMRGSPARPGTHTAQVFVFDRQSRLCYRTADAPAVSELQSLLTRIANSDG